MPLLVTLLLVTAVTRVGAEVDIVISTNEEFSRIASRLEAWEGARLSAFERLIGLEGGARSPETNRPIQVILINERDATESGIAPWVAGFARGDRDTVVLLPTRVPVYPHSSLEELLGHEVAHILVYRAAAGQPLPRWFQEGLAMLAEDSWGLRDRALLTRALLRRGRYDLADLQVRFGDPRQVGQAYALSGAFVREVVRRYGRDVPKRLLRQVAMGGSFESAFRVVTGQTLAEAEESFWKRFTFWYRWLPILLSSSTFWFAVLGLALLAGIRRRARTRAIEARWKLEEFDPTSGTGPDATKNVASSPVGDDQRSIR